VLFKQRFWGGIADGSVTLAFRRWRRPSVKAGGRRKAPPGLLAIEQVEIISPERITDDDALRAGYESRVELLAELEKYPDGDLYRIAFRLAGEDPRVALRERSDLSEAEAAALLERLARLDRASKSGPWTQATLRLISEQPARRAGDLAPLLGMDLQPFKLNVRKLKDLGLTESLGTGYRISPRGAAVLEALRT
jgi:hypothetical protein